MARTYVALLRGINVGGKHKLPMKDLRAIFESVGATDVRSYIQSGNIVFTATKAGSSEIPPAVEAEIETQFGFSVPIVVRSEAELQQIYTRNPLYDGSIEPKHLHVAFLSKAPAKARTAELQIERFLPDSFLLDQKNIYVKYPNGASRAKLNNLYFEETLGVISTMRNWNTVGKLIELCATDGE